MSIIFFPIFIAFSLALEGNGTVTERSIIKSEVVTEAIEIKFSNESVVSEMQHTTCSIKTDEIVAKAESTATRILTGVCTSEEMIKAFENIEKKFLDRLEQIEQTLATFVQAKTQSIVQRKNHKKTKILSPFKTIEYLFDENVFKNYA